MKSISEHSGIDFKRICSFVYAAEDDDSAFKLKEEDYPTLKEYKLLVMATGCASPEAECFVRALEMERDELNNSSDSSDLVSRAEFEALKKSFATLENHSNDLSARSNNLSALNFSLTNHVNALTKAINDWLSGRVTDEVTKKTMRELLDKIS